MRGRLLSAAVGALAATLVLVPLAGGGPADLYRSLLGPGLVRAEIVKKDRTGLHLYRLDRGRVRGFTRSSITLRELDGSIVVVPVAPAARIELGGQLAGWGAVRRGMIALTVRDGEAPAHRVLLQLPR